LVGQKQLPPQVKEKKQVKEPNNQPIITTINESKVPLAKQLQNDRAKRELRSTKTQDKKTKVKTYQQILPPNEDPKEECKLTSEEVAIYGSRCPAGYKQTSLLGK